MGNLPAPTRVIIICDKFKNSFELSIKLLKDENRIEIYKLAAYIKRDILSISGELNCHCNREFNYLQAIGIFNEINVVVYHEKNEPVNSLLQNWDFMPHETKESILLSFESCFDILDYFFSYDYLSCLDLDEKIKNEYFDVLDNIYFDIFKNYTTCKEEEEINSIKSKIQEIKTTIENTKLGKFKSIREQKDEIRNYVDNLGSPDFIKELINEHEKNISKSDQNDIYKLTRVYSFAKEKKRQ